MLDPGGTPSYFDESRVVVSSPKTLKPENKDMSRTSLKEKEISDNCICSTCCKNDVCIFIPEIQLLMARFQEAKSDINLDDRFGYTISCKSYIEKSHGIGIR